MLTRDIHRLRAKPPARSSPREVICPARSLATGGPLTRPLFLVLPARSLACPSPAAHSRFVAARSALASDERNKQSLARERLIARVLASERCIFALLAKLFYLEVFLPFWHFGRKRPVCGAPPLPLRPKNGRRAEWTARLTINKLNATDSKKLNLWR